MIVEGEELQRLERENAKLRKINAALMSRVERAMDQPANAFNLFEVAISLDATVRRRTTELQAALRSVERTNEALKRAKERADEANSFKSTFLAFVSHDLLQPLNAAKLSLSALIGVGDPAEPGPVPAAGRPRAGQSRGSHSHPTGYFQARRGRHEAGRVELRDRKRDWSSARGVRAAGGGERLEAEGARIGGLGAFRPVDASPHPPEPAQQRASLHAPRRSHADLQTARGAAASRSSRHGAGHSRRSARGDLRGISARSVDKRRLQRFRPRPVDRAPARVGAGASHRSGLAGRRRLDFRHQPAARSRGGGRAGRRRKRSNGRLLTASTAPRC